MVRTVPVHFHMSFIDYTRRLPKIKAWIDENNPGDPLIPFSVALEERLAPLTAEEKEEEQKKAGAASALGKITHAGYASLDVSHCLLPFTLDNLILIGNS